MCVVVFFFAAKEARTSDKTPLALACRAGRCLHKPDSFKRSGQCRLGSDCSRLLAHSNIAPVVPLGAGAVALFFLPGQIYAEEEPLPTHNHPAVQLVLLPTHNHPPTHPSTQKKTGPDQQSVSVVCLAALLARCQTFSWRGPSAQEPPWRQGRLLGRQTSDWDRRHVNIYMYIYIYTYMYHVHTQHVFILMFV